jgi:hypothetical protein
MGNEIILSIRVEINHFIFYIDLSSFLIKTTIHHYLLYHHSYRATEIASLFVIDSQT